MDCQDPEFIKLLLSRLEVEGLVDRGNSEHLLLNIQQSNVCLVEWLVQDQKIDATQIARVLAQHLSLPYLNLSDIDFESLLCNRIEIGFVRVHRVLPVSLVDGILTLAIAEPSQLNVLEEIAFVTNLVVRPVIVAWDKLMRVVEEFLSRTQYNALHQFKFLGTDQGRDDQQVVYFVQQILLDAVMKKVSDVHIEPYKASYRIRLRVDGILHQVSELSVELSNRIIARLKVMSKLDISERRLPQDGRFSFKMTNKQAIDCRVNVCPTLSGEKAVVRILDANHTSLNIDDLGFEEEQKQLFMQAIQRPQGMILVTGPTGSGKTVTLYSMLNHLNTTEKNISTVEDPVEIQLIGVNQVNVHTKINLGFPNVLRAFLRQDPDILMIGEIRDQETAEIAIKAAQTGHLVLSTLHTNNAAETINRLAAMNLPVYAIASVINLIVAQRLLRKLCVYCKRKYSGDKNLLKNMGFQGEDLKNATLFNPVGCNKCMNGYKGRIGVFEILPITSYLSHLIMKSASSLQLSEEAKHLGMLSLREAAIKKVFSGITTLDEVQRVI